MKRMTPNDIVGSRIAHIYSVNEKSDRLDYSTFYFRTDRNICFHIPFSLDEWLEAVVPADAKELPNEYVEESFSRTKNWLGLKRWKKNRPIKNDVIKQMKSQPIKSVGYLKDMEDDSMVYDGAFILLNNNKVIMCASSAPKGISTGIFLKDFAELNEYADTECTDYFTKEKMNPL